MATIGSIVVELRANSAKFQADMDKARKGIKNLGGDVDLSKKKVENFAKEIVGMAGVSSRVADAFVGVAAGSKMFAGALQAVQKAALPLLVVMTALEILDKQFEIWRKLADVVGLSEKSFEAAAAAHKKFSDELRTSQQAAIGFANEIRAAADATEVLRRRSVGDETGAVGAELRARLNDIAAERQARIADAESKVADAGVRQAQIIAIERAALAKRQLANEEHGAKQRAISEAIATKIIEDAEKVRQELAKKWQDETQELVGQLKARLDARKQFEAQLGQGAPANSAEAGTAAVRQAREAIEERALRLAYLEREGRLSGSGMIQAREDARREAIAKFDDIQQKFGHIPDVMREAQRWIDSIQFGNFGKQVEEGRQWIDKFVATTSELNQRVDDLNTRLTSGVPASVDMAIPAIRRLIDEYYELALAVYQVNLQVAYGNQLAAAA